MTFQLLFSQMRPISFLKIQPRKMLVKNKKKGYPDLHIFMQMWCVIEGLS